ncbi:MAG: hypothetical protein Q4C79_06600, partial [Neisseria sp.]|uniref:hypothetical protein n=1 Tax=Neisseria sp. TaxID=192066 RepID=UPI0026DA94F6
AVGIRQGGGNEDFALGHGWCFAFWFDNYPNGRIIAFIKGFINRNACLKTVSDRQRPLQNPWMWMQFKA